MTAPPRSWCPHWPGGRPAPGAPAATAWVAQLAQHLAGHLAARGESVESFAARCELDPRTIRGVLNGNRWPTLATVNAIVDASN